MAGQLGLDQLEPLFDEARPFDGESEALARVDAKLTALQAFLAEHNLAGLVLSGDAQQLPRTMFEQRTRIADASAMVHAILSEER